MIKMIISDLESLPGLVQSVLDQGNDILPIATDFINVE